MTKSSAERVRSLRSWHDDWTGLRVAVLGLGATGFSVADTLRELGSLVRVIYGQPDEGRERLLDVIGSERFCDSTVENQLEDLKTFAPDLVIVSPEYRPDHPLTEWAQSRGIVVWGDIQLAWRLRDKSLRVADWLCVTGSKGKTTTARMTAHMLVSGGVKAAPVGDRETPILDALRDPEGFDALVVELSSFQLSRLGDISPYASVCINIYDNHPDWHGSQDSYVATKGRVYENTQVACIYNRAEPATEQLVINADVVDGARAVSFGFDTPPSSGLGLVEEILVDRGFHEERRSTALELVTLDELRSRGLDTPQLIQDVLVGAALARSRGVGPDAISNAILNFALERDQAL